MAGKILKDYTPSEIQGLTDFSESNRRFANDLHSQPQDAQDYSRRSGGGGGSNPTPWYDAFRLDHGKDGARITQGWLEWYVTTIVFEKKFIYDVDGVLLEDVNSLASQESIEGVKVLDMDQAAEYDEERWLQLDWWGDVWAIVELSEETGEPLKLTIEPNDGNMRPIPRLDSSLSRGSSGSEFLILSSRYSAKKRTQKTSVMIKGVRRGFAGIRNQYATYDDFVDNECRLNPRMTREQIVDALRDRGVTE